MRLSGFLIIILSVLILPILVSAASEFLPYARSLADHGIITSHTDESGYRFGDAITRAEMAKIAVRLVPSGTVTESGTCSGKSFIDVNTDIGDLCKAIEDAAHRHIVSTSNDRFRPNDPVTRAEMAKMLLSALHVAPSAEDSGFHDLWDIALDLRTYISAGVQTGYFHRGETFRPGDPASRGEVFKVAAIGTSLQIPDTTVPDTTTFISINTKGSGSSVTSSTSKYDTLTPAPLSTVPFASDEVPNDTSVLDTISISGATLTVVNTSRIGSTTPKASIRIPALQFQLTASNGDIAVTSLSLTRTGISTHTDIASIEVHANGSLAGPARTVPKNDVVVYPVRMRIASGVSVNVTVSFTLSSTVLDNSQITFSLSDITTTATPLSGLPVSGGIYTVSASRKASLLVVRPDENMPRTITSGSRQSLANPIFLENTETGRSLRISDFSAFIAGDGSGITRLVASDSSGTFVIEGIPEEDGTFRFAWSGGITLSPEENLSLMLRGDVPATLSGRTIGIGVRSVDAEEFDTGIGARYRVVGTGGILTSPMISGTGVPVAVAIALASPTSSENVSTETTTNPSNTTIPTPNTSTSSGAVAPTITSTSAIMTSTATGVFRGFTSDTTLGAKFFVPNSTDPETLGIYHVSVGTAPLLIRGISFALIPSDNPSSLPVETTLSGGIVGLAGATTGSGMAGRIYTNANMTGYPIATSNPFTSVTVEISSSPDSGYVPLTTLAMNGGVFSQIATNDWDGPSGYASSRISATLDSARIPADSGVYLRIRGVVRSVLPDVVRNHSYRIVMHRLILETSAGGTIVPVYATSAGDNQLDFAQTFGRSFTLVSGYPKLVTMNSTSSRLFIGDQDIFRFTVSPQGGSMRIAKMVFRVSSRLGFGASDFTGADLTTGARFYTDSGAELTHFRLFVGGTDVTDASGLRFYPVLSAGAAYLVVEAPLLITIDRDTIILLRANATTVTAGNTLTVSMPRIATIRQTDTSTETILPTPSGANAPPSAALVWTDGGSGSSIFSNEILPGVASVTDTLLPEQTLTAN